MCNNPYFVRVLQPSIYGVPKVNTGGVLLWTQYLRYCRLGIKQATIIGCYSVTVRKNHLT